MDILKQYPELFGLSPLSEFPEQPSLRIDCLNDWLRLQNAAKDHSIDLQLISGVRTFDKQKEIWNAKAQGQRDLLDENGEPLHFEELSQEEVLFAILRWSALPGLSRHHWGTDGDVIDARALKTWQQNHPNYKVQLSPWEYSQGGPFEKLGQFLNEYLEDFGFFRPYRQDLGGVAPEPWHLSHKNSLYYLQLYNLELFQDFIKSSFYQDLALIDLVKENSQEIFENYFLKISGPLRP
jgi:LAS superfamily LD-carboxypeptidase LdcB